MIVSSFSVEYVESLEECWELPESGIVCTDTGGSFFMRRGRQGSFVPDGAPARADEYEAKKPPPTRLRRVE